MTIVLLLLAAVAVFAVALALGRRHAASRERAHALAQVLDAADALEARLRTARAEIEAIAGTDDNPVREALQCCASACGCSSTAMPPRSGNCRRCATR